MPAGVTFADLAAKKLPAPRWVIEGLLPAGLSVLAGKPKIGKSWLTLDLSLAVAGGGKVLGRYDAKRGAVLHLALEDTERRFQDRLKRALDGAPAPDGAHFFNEWRRVEDHGLTALRRWLDQHPDTRLVVVDTLAKMRPRQSGKDNLYRADYEAIEQLKRVADEHSVGIVVVHHERKATADDHLDRVSGSTGLTGAADTILTLARERGQMDAVLSVTGRDVEEQELALSMDPRTMRWASRGDAADFRMSHERRQIVETLIALGRPAAPKEIAELVGRQRHAVNKSLLLMVSQGQLEWLAGGKYQLTGRRDEKE
jgi:predicted transcriptional regulator